MFQSIHCTEEETLQLAMPPLLKSMGLQDVVTPHHCFCHFEVGSLLYKFETLREPERAGCLAVPIPSAPEASKSEMQGANLVQSGLRASCIKTFGTTSFAEGLVFSRWFQTLSVTVILVRLPGCCYVDMSLYAWHGFEV